MLDHAELCLWLVLAGVVAALFAVDFLLLPRWFGRSDGMRQAVLESAGWIAAGLLFTVFVWETLGDQRALEYLTAYLVEKSLSADNLFVFAAVFEYFRIRPRHQHRVLFLGILGAVVLRGVFIFAGLALLQRIEWLMYVFGAILVVTGVRLGLKGFRHEEQEAANIVVRTASRLLPVDDTYQGKRFWYRDERGLWVTPAALALIAIESSDIVFAIDSVPAVLAVTRDLFVAYSSNIFAILGLRALYFVLAGAMRELPLIRPMMALILVLIGIKMLVSHFIEPPVWAPLGLIFGLLMLAAAGSVWSRRRDRTGAPKR